MDKVQKISERELEELYNSNISNDVTPEEVDTKIKEAIEKEDIQIKEYVDKGLLNADTELKGYIKELKYVNKTDVENLVNEDIDIYMLDKNFLTEKQIDTKISDEDKAIKKYVSDNYEPKGTTPEIDDKIKKYNEDNHIINETSIDAKDEVIKTYVDDNFTKSNDLNNVIDTYVSDNKITNEEFVTSKISDEDSSIKQFLVENYEPKGAIPEIDKKIEEYNIEHNIINSQTTREIIKASITEQDRILKEYSDNKDELLKKYADDTFEKKGTHVDISEQIKNYNETNHIMNETEVDSKDAIIKTFVQNNYTLSSDLNNVITDFNTDNKIISETEIDAKDKAIKDYADNTFEKKGTHIDISEQIKNYNTENHIIDEDAINAKDNEIYNYVDDETKKIESDISNTYERKSDLNSDIRKYNENNNIINSSEIDTKDEAVKKYSDETFLKLSDYKKPTLGSVVGNDNILDTTNGYNIVVTAKQETTEDFPLIKDGFVNDELIKTETITKDLVTKEELKTEFSEKLSTKIDKIDGGFDGQIMAKSGDTFVWKDDISTPTLSDVLEQGNVVDTVKNENIKINFIRHTLDDAYSVSFEHIEKLPDLWTDASEHPILPYSPKISIDQTYITFINQPYEKDGVWKINRAVLKGSDLTYTKDIDLKVKIEFERNHVDDDGLPVLKINNKEITPAVNMVDKWRGIGEYSIDASDNIDGNVEIYVNDTNPHDYTVDYGYIALRLLNIEFLPKNMDETSYDLIEKGGFINENLIKGNSNFVTKTELSDRLNKKIDKVDGGKDGDVLIKKGDDMIWAKPSTATQEGLSDVLKVSNKIDNVGGENIIINVKHKTEEPIELGLIDSNGYLNDDLIDTTGFITVNKLSDELKNYIKTESFEDKISQYNIDNKIIDENSLNNNLNPIKTDLESKVNKTYVDEQLTKAITKTNIDSILDKYMIDNKIISESVIDNKDEMVKDYVQSTFVKISDIGNKITEFNTENKIINEIALNNRMSNFKQYVDGGFVKNTFIEEFGINKILSFDNVINYDPNNEKTNLSFKNPNYNMKKITNDFLHPKPVDNENVPHTEGEIPSNVDSFSYGWKNNCPAIYNKETGLWINSSVGGDSTYGICGNIEFTSAFLYDNDGNSYYSRASMRSGDWEDYNVDFHKYIDLKVILYIKRGKDFASNPIISTINDVRGEDLQTTTTYHYVDIPEFNPEKEEKLDDNSYKLTYIIPKKYNTTERIYIYSGTGANATDPGKVFYMEQFFLTKVEIESDEKTDIVPLLNKDGLINKALLDTSYEKYDPKIYNHDY